MFDEIVAAAGAANLGLGEVFPFLPFRPQLATTMWGC